MKIEKINFYVTEKITSQKRWMSHRCSLSLLNFMRMLMPMYPSIFINPLSLVPDVSLIDCFQTYGADILLFFIISFEKSRICTSTGYILPFLPHREHMFFLLKISSLSILRKSFLGGIEAVSQSLSRSSQNR